MFEAEILFGFHDIQNIEAHQEELRKSFHVSRNYEGCRCFYSIQRLIRQQSHSSQQNYNWIGEGLFLRAYR